MKIYVSKIIKFQEPDQGSEISWSLGKGNKNKQLLDVLKHIIYISRKIRFVLTNV
jgi:hypothetical protein